MSGKIEPGMLLYEILIWRSDLDFAREIVVEEKSLEGKGDGKKKLVKKWREKCGLRKKINF